MSIIQTVRNSVRSFVGARNPSHIFVLNPAYIPSMPFYESKIRGSILVIKCGNTEANAIENDLKGKQIEYVRANNPELVSISGELI